MLQNKLLYKGIVLLSTIGLLAACGNEESANETVDETSVEETTDEAKEETTEADSESTEEDDVPEKPESLHMWVHEEEAQLEAYEVITERFTEEYGIDVQITPYAQGDQIEGVSLDGPQGIGPDLFYTAHDNVGNIHLQGLAAELELTEDQQERLNNYDEGAVTSFSYEGIQYGIPSVVETYVLFYNKDLVPEAPTTMDELMDIATDLTDGDTYGFLIDATNFYFSYPFLTGPGGYVFAQDDDGVYDVTDIGLNTDGAVEGAEMIQSWYSDDILPSGVDTDIVMGVFQEGNAALAVTGPWAIPDFTQELGDSMGIAPLPEWDGNNLSSFSGNKGWLVNYYTENLYWATELALFISNAENGETYYEIAGELPAHNDSVIEDELMLPVLEQIEYAEPMPNVPEMSAVWEPMANALSFISQGDDPREVLDEAVEQIEANISMMNE